MTEDQKQRIANNLQTSMNHAVKLIQEVQQNKSKDRRIIEDLAILTITVATIGDLMLCQENDRSPILLPH